MQFNRCPVCHHRLSLEMLVQDQVGRELLTLMTGLSTETGTALASYLSLFRSDRRDLTNDRALRLAREVLNLGDTNTVTCALHQVVHNLKGKGQLKNHNYLKKVVASSLIPQANLTAAAQATRPAAPISKTGEMMRMIEEMKK